MPYINQSERAELDEAVDHLAQRILRLPTKGVEDHAGRLNYVATRLALTLFGVPKYWKIALICGVFSNVKDEFYRRLAAPYEDKKIAENGDVYPPS